MARVFNFSAGPAVLPLEVLERAKREMEDWHGSGMSIMEMSHRGKQFTQVAEQAEQDLRELLSIPDHYKVLFLQGGASSQFAMVPLNMLGDQNKADYINTGAWSKKAIAEAKQFGSINVCATTEETNFTTVPEPQDLALDRDAAYVHYTPNETIGGVEFPYIPETGSVPLVADMSSNILSKPIDVAKFGLIYAGAQKNIGPAGLTVVILDPDCLAEPKASTPTMLMYKTHIDNDSMYNTPPTYSWYLAGLVFDWLKQKGGVAAMQAINERKASKLYAAIDASGFYSNPVAPHCRSLMNVPFTLSDDKLDSTFLDQASAEGLVTLKGHRSVGGMRASIYNAMPEEGVDALIQFMQHFENQYG